MPAHPPSLAPLAPAVSALLRAHMLRCFVPAYAEYNLADHAICAPRPPVEPSTEPSPRPAGRAGRPAGGGAAGHAAAAWRLPAGRRLLGWASAPASEVGDLAVDYLQARLDGGWGPDSAVPLGCTAAALTLLAKRTQKQAGWREEGGRREGAKGEGEGSGDEK